jgi:hypothetical protein
MDADQIVTLVGELVWPVVVLVLLWTLRRQVRSAFKAVGDRISDPTTRVGVGPSGLEMQTDLEVFKARLGTLEVAQDQQASVIVSQVRSTSTASASGIPEELRQLARSYRAILIENWRERVNAKVALSNEMGVLIIKCGVPRDLIAEDGDEVLLVGLAAAVILDPEPEDVERLLKASGRGIERLHVRYRLLVALGRLHERNLISAAQRERLVPILEQFRDGADRSLLERINSTATWLKRSAS